MQSLPQPDLDGLVAIDLAVLRPKTLAANATVGAVRVQFENDHVRLALLTHEGRLLGTLIRSDLPSSLTDEELALPHARLPGRVVGPNLPAHRLQADLLAHGERRVAVVGPDGLLLGLVCLNRKQTGFCSDQGVAAREAERVGMRRLSDSDQGH